MQFTRPFTGKDLHYFQKAADLGFDFVELLVPEPEDDLSIADVKAAADDAGIFTVLAARVNPQRSIASEDAAGGTSHKEYTTLDPPRHPGARVQDHVPKRG